MESVSPLNHEVLEIKQLECSQVGIYHEPGHQKASGSDTESDSGADPIAIIEDQRRHRRQATRQNAVNVNNHDDNNIDPQLRAACPQHQNNLDLQLTGTHSQHENRDPQAEPLSAGNRQTDAWPPPNLNCMGPAANLQRQSQGDSQQPPSRAVTPESPLTDVDMNHQGSPEPPLANSNAHQSAHQKRQARSGPSATSETRKKQKANSYGIRKTRSQGKKASKVSSTSNCVSLFCSLLPAVV